MAMKSDESSFDNVDIGLHLDYKPWLVNLILFISDSFSIFASFFIAVTLRHLLVPVMGGVVDINVLFPMVEITFIIIIGLFIFKGLYPGQGRTGVVELKEIASLVTIAYLILGVAIYILGFGSQFSRMVYFISFLFTLVLISSLRLFIHNRGSLLSWWARPAIIIGNRQEAEEVTARLLHSRRMAYKPVVLLLLSNVHTPSQMKDLPVYSYTPANLEWIRQLGVDLAIFASSNDEANFQQKEIINSLSVIFSHLLFVINTTSLSSLSLQTVDLEGYPTLKIHYHLMEKGNQFIKRSLDLFLCLISFVITIPIFLVIAVLIHLDSPGPILYKQERIGKGGKHFNLYKFRTMKQNADQELIQLLENDQNLKNEYQKFHKLGRDPRVTRVGRFLRKLSLDEFPQILNIIQGDMSFVGPRPYMPEEQDAIGDRLEIILRVAPGLTGWWQVMGRHTTTFEERIDLDIYYISNFSIWLDVYILIKTFWIIIKGKGI